ncbi:hypothetical protein GCM10027036_20900 [Flavihumibacter cheonanensis]
MNKLDNRSSENVAKNLIKKFVKCQYPIHTITFDNEKGFAGYRDVSKALQAYFIRPYTSQDKGTVANRIGQIRQFLPKKTDLSNVTNEEIKSVVLLLINRPVRKFNYKTPNQG